MPDEGQLPAKAPWHLWVVGALSLLWNLVGVLDFVMTETRNPAYMKGFTAEQLEFYYGFPLWVVVAWGVAVWSGALGSLFLLLRRRVAAHCFLWSLACLALTTIRNYAFSDGMRTMGSAGALAFSAVIFAIAVLLLVYARSMGRRGVLR